VKKDSGFPVSVIVCAFNAERYIVKTIESILAQTYETIDVLIIDDASSDSTPEIVEHAMTKDTRIRYLRMAKNKGLAKARQEGIDAARYDWIIFVDADDILLPEMISVQVNAVMNDRDLIGVGTYAYYIGEDEKKLLGIMAVGPTTKEEFFDLYNRNKMLFLSTPFLGSKAHIMAVGGMRVGCFPEREGTRWQDLCEDLDLRCRLSDLGSQGKYMIALPIPLYCYRKRLDSMSGDIFGMQRKMRWIKDCLVRRRRGMAEISFEDFERSFSVLTRLHNFREDYAAWLYRKTAMEFAKRNYLCVVLLLPFVVLLSPKYIWQKINSQRIRRRVNNKYNA
jgi:glycosyltransferase involved in cell wall biosynthesis